MSILEIVLVNCNILNTHMWIIYIITWKYFYRYVGEEVKYWYIPLYILPCVIFINYGYVSFSFSDTDV